MNIGEMQAGQEFDALIAERVMGWVVNCDNTYVTETVTMTEAWKPIPRFSTDLAAAQLVAEKLHLAVALLPLADTPELAICRAALEAMERWSDG